MDLFFLPGWFQTARIFTTTTQKLWTQRHLRYQLQTLLRSLGPHWPFSNACSWQWPWRMANQVLWTVQKQDMQANNPSLLLLPSNWLLRIAHSQHWNKCMFLVHCASRGGFPAAECKHRGCGTRDYKCLWHFVLVFPLKGFLSYTCQISE